MKIDIQKELLTNINQDVQVLYLYEHDKNLSQQVIGLDNELNNIITEFILKENEFEGKFGEFYVIPAAQHTGLKKVLLAGLGKKDKLKVAKAREIAAKTIQKCKSFNNAKNIGICVDAFSDYDYSKVGQLLVEGFLIGDYKFDKHKSNDKDKKIINKITLLEADNFKHDLLARGAKLGEKIANAVNFARDLINESAQEVTPEKLAEIAKDLKDVEVKVYDKPEIEEMKMGAFLAVGQGSIHSPKFIHITYKPEKPKRKIALIGKGITFDSGGLDIKPPASMLTMKDDMSGAAAILAIMNCIPSLNLDIEIHGIIAACENMPSGSSYKPGDIITAKNGKTIEVDNTDAEGRLTLADALCFADELKTDEIIDIATLTGACMVALGSVASGLMGTNKTMIKDIIDCGDFAGEKYWELPMFEEYGDSLKSDIADMKNTGSRYGGASTAAIFLKNFVKNKNWCHIDIAGTAFLDKPQKELLAKGGAGSGIRTLIEYLLK